MAGEAEPGRECVLLGASLAFGRDGGHIQAAGAQSHASGEIPVVMHRRNREPWKVSMWMENFRKIYSDDVFDDLKPCIRGGIVTLLLDTWICYYRDWQAGKEMGSDGR